MKSRSRLTWLDARGKRTGILVDRPGRTLLVTQAAWATLANRQPLLDGKPPYQDKAEARAILDKMLLDPMQSVMAARALRSVQP